MTTARFLPGVSPDEYHLLPGLSSSIATTLIAKSPAHAYDQHPLYGNHGKAPTKEMDLGSVVHALSLGLGKPFAVLEFDNYKTKLAQESRDTARARGLIPILAREHDEAQVIASKVRHQLAERGLALDGVSELAFAWSEPSSSGPVECRGMADHVKIDQALIIDLKIVGNAAPSHVERSAENFGYAIQAVAYSRALAAIDPSLAGRVQFLFAFCESVRPFAINISRPDGLFRELGERRWLRAVETWGRCLAENAFPAYGSDINYLSSPPWALTKEESL